jgi:feruloyl esterase
LRREIDMGLLTLFFGVAAVAAGIISSIPASLAIDESHATPAIVCGDLSALRLPDVRIVAATAVVPSPTWKPPAETNYASRASVSVPFCRVEGTIEKEIGFELWLPPKQSWNGRFLGLGNGGFAGFIRYDGLARGVTAGFASASTDTGHKSTEKNWVIGNPRRLENYGHRGQHLTAVNAKKIVAAYYGQAAHHNYFMGCSGGGMQAMNEVQRYPADYDGIVAGAHGRSIIGISARWLSSALYAQNDPNHNLSTADWNSIAQAAITKCDANDGVRDGIINEPRSCQFDIAETPGLSSEKVKIARSLYGPIMAKDGHILFPGFDPGVAISTIKQPGSAGEAFAHWYYDDPNWDFNQFDPAYHIPLVEAAIPGISFTNPNLEGFARRGGKLISYHGWCDQIVPAQATIDYYDSVVKYLGREATDKFYKLYVVPGMAHCSGGVGPDNFGAGSVGPAAADSNHDMLSAIVDWVENDKAPQQIIASKIVDGKVTVARPLCPYPQVARYSGNGDTNDPGNFRCVAP